MRIGSVTNVYALLAERAPRENVNVLSVDGAYAFRVAKIRGSFPWHHHPGHDEGWLVLKGAVEIRFESGESLTLRTGDVALVPADTVHSPRALEEETMVGIVNARSFPTVYREAEESSRAGYQEFDLGPDGLLPRS